MPEGLHTINEMLHLSALDRWRLDEVLHDAMGKNGQKVPYRPPNLQAIINKRNVPVVDSNGDVIPQDLVPWP